MTKTQQRLERLIILGFKSSYIIRGGMIKPKCDQCEAIVINGIPCHETGCINTMHECSGCNEIIPLRQRYCEVCA